MNLVKNVCYQHASPARWKTLSASLFQHSFSHWRLDRNPASWQTFLIPQQYNDTVWASFKGFSWRVEDTYGQLIIYWIKAFITFKGKIYNKLVLHWFVDMVLQFVFLIKIFFSKTTAKMPSYTLQLVHL